MRDLKLVQRGVNIQANDLAVPPGTLLRATNIDFQRDGVAARRAGFDGFYAGLPTLPIDSSYPLSLGARGDGVRGAWELFSRDRAFVHHGGFPFTYDEGLDSWLCVPVDMPHKVTFFGDANNAGSLTVNGNITWACGFGRGVNKSSAADSSRVSPLRWQNEWDSSHEGFVGCPGGGTSDARDFGTAGLLNGAARFYQPADVANGFVSDSNTIRRLTFNGFGPSGMIAAGSLTATGATDGIGKAATMNGASWMCEDGAGGVFFADNTNMIRRMVFVASITAASIVTTLAGSITAGDSNGYRAPIAALWTQHNASSVANWGSVTYSSTLGSGSGRLCAIETGTATTKAMTSDDGGVTWTARTLPTSRNWMCVTWAAGLSLFVAVAQDGALSGRCATSPDGITWTSRTTPDGTWASVAWSSSLSRLVAVGLSTGPAYAMTSTNGTTWTTSGVTQIAGYWVSVVAAGALGFVAVGQFDTGNGVVMVSSTGLNWSVSGVSVPEANQWMSVTYSATLTRLVAVSSDGTNRVMTSTDGTTWTAVAATAANLWSGVCWSDSFGVFIAVSQDGTNRIMYSQLGTGGWTAAAAPDTNQWYAIVDAPLIGYVVSTSLGVLDAVMRANSNGASFTGALFNSISGLAYKSGYIYVTESAGHRVRKVNASTGEATVFAGSITATSGHTNGTGEAARFNTPVGCEIIGDTLYVGDSGNNRIRAVTLAGAVVTDYAGTGSAISASSNVVGMRGGQVDACELPGVVLRSKYTPYEQLAAQSAAYLVVETTTTRSDTQDVGLIYASDTSVAGERLAHHIVRCPNSYANGTNGPNKLGSVGPAALGASDSRGVDAGGGILFTSSERPRVIDTWQRVADKETLPRFRVLGIDASEAPSMTAVAGTTFAAGTAVAYRVVCGLSLPDGRVSLGPPSERVTLIGSSTATWSGSVTAFPAPSLPYDGMPFVQVYRTRSLSSITDPGDQMFLCYESALLYGSGVSFTDQLPDDLLGAELYTNTTEDGIAATALAPPGFALDAASFGDRVVLSNVVRPATLKIKFLGTSGLVAGASTISLWHNVIAFTVTPGSPSGVSPATLDSSFGSTRIFLAVSTATSPSELKFQIASGGTASQNAAQTARNFVTCVNRSPDAYIYQAQYDESDPGTVIITCLVPGRAATKEVIARNTSLTEQRYVNQVSVYMETTATSSVITLGNILGTTSRDVSAIVYSEVGAFDSFPAGNEARAGAATEAVQRLLSLSDTLIAVKDDSVWSMDVGFEPRIYDKALSCSLPDSFAMVNNQWIGCFTRGFVALSSAQAVAIGRPIDRDVTAQYGQPQDGFTSDRASAAAIDLSGNYLCVFNERIYVYNVVARAWSDWDIGVVAGDSSGGFEAVAVGAYLDTFMVAQNGARSLLRQRRWQRDGTAFYKDFADPTYALGTATLAADLQTMTITAYSATVNPGELPPVRIDPPAGAIAGAGNDAADFWWVFSLTQGSVTAQAFGVLAVTTPASATSAMTITLAQALTDITAGSVTVTGYAPIVCRVQYAPFAATGANAGFGDALITVERCQPGYMVARFFGRQDLGDASVHPVGWYADSYGVSRAKLMPSITSSGYGVASAISYNDVVRIPVARERAVGQTLGLELWEGVAWQPLAIKAVTLDKGDKDNTKVTQ